jgi:hypothetical protein
MVVGVALAVQAMFVGDAVSRWAAATGCVAAVCFAYLLGIRPVVTEMPTYLEVRNPLRTAKVWWSSITKVDVDDVVRVHAGDVVVRCFALPRRDRRPITSGFASAFGGRTLPDSEPVRAGYTTFDVVEAIEDRSRSLRGGNAPDGPPEVDVDPRAMAVLIVGTVNTVACAMLLVL